jgi:hypothetical protein
MNLISDEYIGGLIEDRQRRADWQALVRALRYESEDPAGRLQGWVFHGTGGKSLTKIRKQGLKPFSAMVSTQPGVWDNFAEGVHFGTAAVAAYFAEDKIEALETQDIELAIFGIKLDRLELFGDFAADGQMVDVPLPTRTKAGDASLDMWDRSDKDWKASLSILESIVVLNPFPIPSDQLIEFSSVQDIENLLSKKSLPRPR